MLTIISVIIALLTVVYLCALLVSFLGLRRLQNRSNTLRSDTRSRLKQPSVSVIVPARNEEMTIAHCIESLLVQDYPAELTQFIVVDDGSEDDTSQIVSYYAAQNKNLFLLSAGDSPLAIRGKKKAVDWGIRNSTGEIILTTDADCTVRSGWIKGLIEHFDDNIGMVAGRTEFRRLGERTFFHKLESLDFTGIVAVEAGAIGIGYPITCNASNLAYRRSAFDQVDGFSSSGYILSGDDDLLMQRISSKTDWRVTFSLDPMTFVSTDPQTDIRAFIHQRSRWASKGKYYPQRWVVVILVNTFLYFFVLFFTVPFSILNPRSFPVPLLSILIKSLVELLVVQKGCRLFHRTDLLSYFPLAEFLHIPYIILVSVLGFFGKFKWKGRRAISS